jgi:hypothetical protein
MNDNPITVIFHTPLQTEDVHNGPSGKMTEDQICSLGGATWTPPICWGVLRMVQHI